MTDQKMSDHQKMSDQKMSERSKEKNRENDRKKTSRKALADFDQGSFQTIFFKYYFTKKSETYQRRN